jgi:hypothetical protein
MLGQIGEMPFPHRHIPADGASGGGADPRERRMVQVRDDFHPPFRVDAEESPLPLKSRNFH